MIAASGLAGSADATSNRPLARPHRDHIVRTTVNPGRFDAWVRAFERRARARGVGKATFDRAFRGVRYRADVIEKDRNQSEFTKQLWEYLDSAVSDSRVRNGRSALRRHRQVLAKIEKAYGVEGRVVAAIWGLESAYGTTRGDIPLIDSLATLAFDGRRGRFFENQLVAALKILQSGDVSPRKMTGSWAGAMGHTQFIPTSYLAYAVDFTGDGKRDIWSNDPADALASTAAYLKRFGWTYGQPWGMEVKLPRGFNYALAGERIKKSPRHWNAMGVRLMTGGEIPGHGRSSILLPGGARGAAFVIFDNFHVIERYNAADAYVVAVGHLSDRIVGGPPIRAGWPRGDRPLRFAERREMQRLLTASGFDTKGVDGIVGPNTIQAVREFQASIGLVPDGYVSFDILRRLR
ncbi:MAG: lytic murein transglycosylase [Pseudomonadota bacterium]